MCANDLTVSTSDFPKVFYICEFLRAVFMILPGAFKSVRYSELSIMSPMQWNYFAESGQENKARSHCLINCWTASAKLEMHSQVLVLYIVSKGQFLLELSS